MPHCAEKPKRVPDELSVYEWIDYWQSGNSHPVKDGWQLSQHSRDELAWAAQSVSHMLATLRDIADMTQEQNNVYDAARVARNAIREYGLTGDVNNGRADSPVDRSPYSLCGGE